MPLQKKIVNIFWFGMITFHPGNMFLIDLKL